MGWCSESQSCAVRVRVSSVLGVRNRVSWLKEEVYKVKDTAERPPPSPVASEITVAPCYIFEFRSRREAGMNGWFSFFF